MNELRICINFKSEESTEKEKWYSLVFEIVNSDISETLKIIDINIEYNDTVDFFEWIRDNEANLMEEAFIGDVEFHQTIAKSIFRFYRQFTDSNDFDMWDKVLQYRQRHGLPFALRGYDVSDIYIGKVEHYHTISLYDKTNEWSYKINLRHFIDHCKILYDDLKSHV